MDKYLSSIISMLLLIIITGCSTSENGVKQEQEKFTGLKLTAQMTNIINEPAVQFDSNSSLYFQMFVDNDTPDSVSFEFDTSQHFEAIIYDSNGEEYMRRSTQFSYDQTPSNLTIAAGETYFAFQWIPDLQQLPAGAYSIESFVVGTELRITNSFSVYTSDQSKVNFSLNVTDRFGQQNDTFSQGEEITFKLTATNENEQPVFLGYSGHSLFDFYIQNEESEIDWQWSHTWGFTTQEIKYIQLDPGVTLEVNVTWDQALISGGNLLPGSYSVTAWDQHYFNQLTTEMTIQ